VSDPFLFDEEETPVDDASLRMRDKLLGSGYLEEDEVPEVETSSMVKRIFKWVLFSVLALFVAVHAYAVMLRFVSPPGTLLMAGQAISGVEVKRRWVSLDDISPHLVTAVIASEDQRFCEHAGVDTDAIRKAYQEYKDGEGLRGGSTITQQTAKNVFLWNGGGVIRKVPEAWFAFVIDATWGKRRVMEVYLNVAEWGDGLFGAEAAARVRFGKPASELTRTEAAMLATVLPSPNKWRVDPPGQYVQRRSRRTLRQMKNIERDGLASCVVK